MTWRQTRLGAVRSNGPSALTRVLVAALLIGSQGSVAGAKAVRKTGKSKVVAKSVGTASPTPTQPLAQPLGSVLQWTGCDGPVECASLTVPVDASNPSLGTTHLGIGRLRARDPKTRKGVLFVNPGGPGGSATRLVRSIADDRLKGTNALGFDDFDVVGVDPRGVGRSDPIRCGTKVSDLGLNPFVTTVDPAARVALRQSWFASCVALSGPLFTHAGTVDAADDLDRVRVALGEEQVDYFGYSYGTILGSVFAARYGPHIRSMALDAAVDATRYGPQYLVDKAVAFESRLTDFSLTCAASPGCAYRTPAHSTATSISDAIGTSIRTIESRSSASLGLNVRSAMYSFLEESANWQSAANYALSLEGAAASQDFASVRTADTAFELLTSDPTYWAVNCADAAFATSAAGAADVAERVRTLAPILGPVMINLNDLCLDWPAVKPLGSLHSTVAQPIVVIAGTRDTRTPLVGAESLVASLGNAVLVLRDGDGHASLPRSACIRRIVDAYFKSGTIPLNNVRCT